MIKLEETYEERVVRQQLSVCRSYALQDVAVSQWLTVLTHSVDLLEANTQLT